MRWFRETIVPVGFLALWVGVSGYTVYALRGLESLRAGEAVEASIDLTVRYPSLAAASDDDER
jgi:hypothetical protein